jgi:chorismate synthase
VTAYYAGDELCARKERRTFGVWRRDGRFEVREATRLVAAGAIARPAATLN